MKPSLARGARTWDVTAPGSEQPASGAVYGDPLLGRTSDNLLTANLIRGYNPVDTGLVAHPGGESGRRFFGT